MNFYHTEAKARRMNPTHFTLTALLFAAGCAASTPPPEVPETTEGPSEEVELPAVAPAPASPTATPAVAPQAPTKTYAEAVQDAAKAEPSEVVTTLLPLLESTPGLVWKGSGDSRRLLVVTWTSWNGYDGKEGQTLPLGRETWITTAPELQRFCQGLTHGAALDGASVLRLEQLLGLPAGGGKDRFVELWVDPADAFRPCPDPETNDRECSLDFPAPAGRVTVSAEHVAWFNDKKATSYGDKGYPWTRLGYTYDWGNPGSEVGLSEFVIRQGASVEVKGVSKNDAYCK